MYTFLNIIRRQHTRQHTTSLSTKFTVNHFGSDTMGIVLSVSRALKLAVLDDTQPTSSATKSQTTTPSALPSQSQPIHTHQSGLKNLSRYKPRKIMELLVVLTSFIVPCYSEWPLFSLVMAGFRVCLVILFVFTRCIVVRRVTG